MCAAGGHTHQSLKGELVWMTTLRLNGAAAFGSCFCLIAWLPLAGAPEALNEGGGVRGGGNGGEH